MAVVVAVAMTAVVVAAVAAVAVVTAAARAGARGVLNYARLGQTVDTGSYHKHSQGRQKAKKP